MHDRRLWQEQLAKRLEAQQIYQDLKRFYVGYCDFKLTFNVFFYEVQKMNA
jgi:hypothetical protein